MLVAFAGCGSDERGTTESRAPTPAQATSTGPSSVELAQQRQEARTQLRGKRTSSAEVALRRYYAALNRGAYEEAWAMLGPDEQAAFGGFAAWAGGYDHTVHTDLTITDARALSDTGKQVELDVELASTDTDVCGEGVDQTFAGAWQLLRQNGTWVSSAVSLRKTGGGVVETDVTNCPGVTVPPTTPDYAPPTVAGVPYDPNDYSNGDGTYLGNPTTQNFGSGQGSIGQCRDGTYSDSVGRQGACSYHGGVSP
jgi:Protein of unknown function (DUF3761)